MPETSKFPTISEDPGQQEHYLACRRAGTSHALAEMFALAQSPSLRTDSTFLQGRCNGNQFEKCPPQGDYYKAEAKKAGVDTTGRVYLSGLAAFPGDPRAWVSGRGDVQRVCEERGWECEGAVNVKGEVRHEHKPIAIADDLVDDEVSSIIEDSPCPQEINREELREKVREKRKPHWAKE